LLTIAHNSLTISTHRPGSFPHFLTSSQSNHSPPNSNATVISTVLSRTTQYWIDPALPPQRSPCTPACPWDIVDFFWIFHGHHSGAFNIVRTAQRGLLLCVLFLSLLSLLCQSLWYLC
jgi:hypothetical protein